VVRHQVGRPHVLAEGGLRLIGFHQRFRQPVAGVPPARVDGDGVAVFDHRFRVFLLGDVPVAAGQVLPLGDLGVAGAAGGGGDEQNKDA
jgi:hypothetical protein